MRPLAQLHLYRVRLRSRLGAELLAVAGIAVGVGLLFASLIASASLTGAVRELSQGIVGEADFQLSARSASGFGPQVLRQVESVRGAAAVPVAEARVNLVGREGRRSVLLVGGDPPSKQAGGALLRVARLPAAVGRPGLLLPARVAERLGASGGEMVRVETGAGTFPVRVAAEVGSSELGSLAAAPVAVAPLPLVQKLAGIGDGISRVFVTAAPGRYGAVEASLRHIAGDRLDLGPADRELALFENAAYPTSASTALFSLLSGLVGFLFALNATLLTVPGRRRLIGDLRLCGYAPGTVFQILLLDAVLLGLAGAGAGLVLGDAASRSLFDSAPGYLSSAFAVGSRRIVTAQSVLLAGASGILAACLSVLLPLRDYLRVDGGEGASSSSAGHGCPALAVAGGALLVLGVMTTVLAPSLSLAGLGVLVLALLLLLQVWLRVAVAAFGAGCRRLRAPAAILAALEVQAGSARIRTLALAATGAVAVFATVSIGGARSDLQRGLDDVAENLDRGAGVWVAFRGPANIFATSAFTIAPRQVRAIERLPAAPEVTCNRGSFLDVGRDRVWVLAPAASRLGMVLRSQLDEGSVAGALHRLRRGGWVTLSEGLADQLGVGVGDHVELPLPRPGQLRVAAVTNNFGWPGGALVLSAGTYAQSWGSGAPASLGVRIAPASQATAVAAAVRSILGPGSPLKVETTDERVQRQRAASRAGLSRLSQISALVLIASVLAMSASMAGLVWQRRSTFAALKVHGLGEGELWRALLLEAGLLLGAGCFLGGVFGLVGQLFLDRALATITGFPVLYETAADTALRALLMLTFGAVAVLALPGWIAVRVRPQAGLAE